MLQSILQNADETYTPLPVSRLVGRNSPGIVRDPSSLSTVETVSLSVRARSDCTSLKGEKGECLRSGDVDSTPGVTGGVGLGVPPAYASGGGAGFGSEKII